MEKTKVLNTWIFFTSRSEMPLIALGGSNYPYMDAEAGELTVGDVERLLSLYKDVVTKYTSLYKAVRHLSMSKTETPVPHSEGTSILLTQPEGTNTKIVIKEETNNNV